MPSLSVNQRGALLSVLMLVVGLLFWEATIPEQQLATEMTEYERLMGGGSAARGHAPTLGRDRQGMGAALRPLLRRGPNDKGIGIQIATRSTV
jgi:nitrate/nitrite transport system permease protein